MLTALRISNFAVIDHLELDFSSGFSVLTGETGAGKSILVDAIGLLVGGRASVEQIRAQADEAVIEGAFTLDPSDPLATRLRETDLLGADACELIVRRILSRAGRNRIYLNGTLTPLHVLQSLGGTLVDIHGQHEQQSLLSDQAQLDMVDAYGRLRTLRAEYAVAYDRWQDRQRELRTATAALAQRSDREDLLRYQVQEIEQANVQPDEEDRLAVERSRLAHAHRLTEAGQEAYARLYDREGAILSELGTVGTRLKEMAGMDVEVDDWVPLIREAEAQLRELAHQLRGYVDRVEHNPERLAEIEQRLDVLQRLKKKYGGTLEAVAAHGRTARRELDDLLGGEERLEDLRRAVADARGVVDALAARLTEGRTTAARKLAGKVAEELAALQMTRARFEVALTTEPDEAGLGPTGRDHIDYLFSANTGEPVQALARVASGGELSRVMLAMKTVLAGMDRVPVLVFDEVDAGVGGEAATVMGRRLRGLARFHQVFCITHLPQIASQAGAHLVVQKSVVKGRTVTRVVHLDQVGRQEEVARMLAGAAVTKAARATAAEMIGQAERAP